MIAALAAAALLSASQSSRIDAIVASVMRESRIAGLSLGIARNGSTLYLRGYGLRDAARNRRADAFTIYAAGSIAKQFTAALVLQDVAQGRLALDQGKPSIQALLWQITDDTWEYRNENYAALGTALERTGNASYCTLASQRIFVPYGLVSTWCGAPYPAWNLAVTQRTPQWIAPAAGGLWSNAPDLLRWLDDLRTGRVVTPASFEAMTTSGHLRGGILTNYGFGFFTGVWYGYPVAFADGLVDGYSSEDALSLSDGLELALLSNGDRVDLTPLAKSVFSIVDPPRDKNSYAVPNSAPENENTPITAAIARALQTPAYASYGKLELLEFTERTIKGTTTYDRYRATFERAVLWVTVEYGPGNAIESVNVSP
ncbi:MAG TPA: serine hydrolase domain-containing protein [Candidatus Baltobacteraceae bacterium]